MLLVRARQFERHLWETVWGYLVRKSQQLGRDTRELVCKTSVEHNLEHMSENSRSAISGQQSVGHLWAKCGRHLWETVWRSSVRRSLEISLGKHLEHIYGKQFGAHQ